MDGNVEAEVEFSLSLIGEWPEPMLLLDGERFIEANPAALRLLGHDGKGKFLGRSLGDVSPPLQPDGEFSSSKARRLLEEVLAGETRRFEWVLLSASGQEIPVDATLSPFRRGEHPIVLCAWHDIGRLKEAERSARHAVDELARSNRDLQQFALAAAHDLQTPLRTISQFTQLLHRETLTQLNEQARQWSALVMDGSKRMQTLVEDLLAYSRLDSSPRSGDLLDFRSLFEEAVSNLAVTIRETGAEVICGDLPRVAGNRTQLVQVLQNLIENGIKYNGSAAPRVEVSARPEAGTWVFSVADNGIGIPPDHREQVFEMFRRLHSQQEYPGTGIGLAICQRVIERHGGRIWVESGVGAGSVFRFTLPVPAHPQY